MSIPLDLKFVQLLKTLTVTGQRLIWQNKVSNRSTRWPLGQFEEEIPDLSACKLNHYLIKYFNLRWLSRPEKRD
jgi:hypothetical protein